MNPFETKAVRTFVNKEVREGTPERRIPIRCAQKFRAFNLEPWLWERYCDEYIADYKKQQTIKINESTLNGYTQVTADESDIILKHIRRGHNIFITGKAGTGKTTLLKRIVEIFNLDGKVVVVAPTGIAAKVAGGATIHSLFRMPIGPWVPNNSKLDILENFTDFTRQILNNITTIIIDEVSMVRCDLLDEMDFILRYARNSQLPFGGLQIILFGDLYQLMPVVTDDDWAILHETYDTPYFFSSLAFKKISKLYVELTKVYRQDEPEFIDILNSIRIGKPSNDALCRLNQRYSSMYAENCPDDAIRLTTHNHKAKSYNNAKLEIIRRPQFEYKAYIEKMYPWAELAKHDFPTDYVLRLKVGARVMFLRNDNAGRQYVNGTLGTVIDLWDDGITVLTDDNKRVNVFKTTWDFYHYRYDKKLKVVTRELYASFKQMPLRLAWCITIHKSQGLTFNKVYIDAEKSFAAGQVYVALSRCKTLNGLHLTSRITPNNIISSETVEKFLSSIGQVVK